MSIDLLLDTVGHRNKKLKDHHHKHHRRLAAPTESGELNPIGGALEKIATQGLQKENKPKSHREQY